ncbi:hypothetical protein [Labilithrix luteola]|uniref:hypothetical protein n=1 Tax=Labilithrix luteola TaxID=1391654 RepID=UPI001F0ACA4D|nr:hypothetical protein [Labilithrix luteola]
MRELDQRVARHVTDEQGTETIGKPKVPDLFVVLRLERELPLAHQVPPAEVAFTGLALRCVVLRGLCGEPFALAGQQLARLVFALLQGGGVELGALPSRHAAGGRGVLRRHVDAFSCFIGQPDTRAEVDRSVRSPEQLDACVSGSQLSH